LEAALGRVIDAKTKSLLDELSQYPDVRPEWRALKPADTMPTMPLSFISAV